MVIYTIRDIIGLSILGLAILAYIILFIYGYIDYRIKEWKKKRVNKN